MIRTEDMVINMGPQHPSTHGVLRMELRVDGELIKHCRVHLGFLHRAHEKLAEGHVYQNIIPYTDRADYLASMNNNLSYCLAVEKLIDQDVPERAEYLRVIVCELNRIASHLIWLGAFAADTGALTPFFHTMREREKIITMFEKLCGARLMYNYIRIGGVMQDSYPGFEEECRAFTQEMLQRVDDYEALLTDNPIFTARTKNIGIITEQDCYDYGLTGPILRAAGVAWDLRRAEPYGVYDRFDFSIPTSQKGDCWGRFVVRVQEIRESCKIVDQALDQMPKGPTMGTVKRVIRPPRGAEVYVRTENPRGELAHYILSDGSSSPYRFKMRAPSYVNLAIIEKILPGHYMGDAPIVLGSIDIVLGEVDR